MNAFRLCRCAAERFLWLALTGLLLLPFEMKGAADEKFDVLRTKTAVYKNVTVTTRATNYLFILHSTGMTSLKVADLLPESQIQLGYLRTNSASGSTNTAAVWAKRELAKINVPQITALKNQVEQKWRAQPSTKLSAMSLVRDKVLWAVLGVALLLYLFHCYCCMLICRKAGHAPGVLVWLPALQLIPLLRAAGMSAWWFLACFVPLLNLVPSVLWPFKIAKARGKSVWVGVLLLLPITSFFAFLYLAFADGKPTEEDEGPEPKVMSLQAA
jgi:hypothetical protein